MHLVATRRRSRATWTATDCPIYSSAPRRVWWTSSSTPAPQVCRNSVLRCHPDVTGLPTTASNVTGAATPALTDVDGDGDLDLLLGGLDGSLRCFLNNGTGAFSGCSASALLSGGGPVAVSGRSAPAVGDLDGDGGADLVVGGANGAFFHLVNAGSTSAPLWAYNGTLAAVEGPSAPAVRPAAAGGPAHVFVGGGDGALAAYTAGGMPVSPDTYRLSALRGDAYGGVALRYTTTEPPGALSAHAVRRRTALALQPLLPVQHTVELWSIAASATSAGATELTLTIRASLGASEAALLASASTVACALEGATAATGPAESDAALAEMRQMAAKPIALSQLLHGGSARPIACDPTKIISPPPLPSPPPPAPAELPPPSFPPPPPNLPVAELWGRDDGATQSVMLQGGLATVSVPVTLISLCAFLRLCLGGMRSLARKRLLERRKKRNQKFARGGGKDGGAGGVGGKAGAQGGGGVDGIGRGGGDGGGALDDDEPSFDEDEDEEDDEYDAESTVVDSNARVSQLVKLWTGTTEADGRRVAMPLVYELVRPPVAGVGVGGRGGVHAHSVRNLFGADGGAAAPQMAAAEAAATELTAMGGNRHAIESAAAMRARYSRCGVLGAARVRSSLPWQLRTPSQLGQLFEAFAVAGEKPDGALHLDGPIRRPAEGSHERKGAMILASDHVAYFSGAADAAAAATPGGAAAPPSTSPRALDLECGGGGSRGGGWSGWGGGGGGGGATAPCSTPLSTPNSPTGGRGFARYTSIREVLLHGRGWYGETAVHLLMQLAASDEGAGAQSTTGGRCPYRSALLRLLQPVPAHLEAHPQTKLTRSELADLASASYEGSLYYGLTPLHLAAAKDDLPIVRALLACGASLSSAPPARGMLLRGVGHRGYLGGTALSFAASAGHVSVVHELINNGAPLDAAVDDRVGRSATGAEVDPYYLDERRPAAEAASVALLHAQHAVWARSANLLQEAAVLAPSRVCTHANAALHLVALHDRHDTYSQLLSLGATPFVRNGWGQSPLALAAAHGSIETFRTALAGVSERVWQCGPIVCVRTPLEEIDPIFKHVGGREFQCCAGKEKRHAPSADGRDGKDGSLLRVGAASNTNACGGYVNGALGNCGRTTVLEVIMRAERGDLMLHVEPLRQLLLDKWQAYGKIAIYMDAILTLGVILLIASSIALSESGRGVATPPGCSGLHGDGSFAAWGERFSARERERPLLPLHVHGVRADRRGGHRAPLRRHVPHAARPLRLVPVQGPLPLRVHLPLLAALARGVLPRLHPRGDDGRPLLDVRLHLGALPPRLLAAGRARARVHPRRRCARRLRLEHPPRPRRARRRLPPPLLAHHHLRALRHAPPHGHGGAALRGGDGPPRRVLALRRLRHRPRADLHAGGRRGRPPLPGLVAHLWRLDRRPLPDALRQARLRRDVLLRLPRGLRRHLHRLRPRAHLPRGECGRRRR